MPSQYRAIWTVPGGGTGYSVFHFVGSAVGAAAQAIADDVRAFFQSLNSILPDDVDINFDSEVLVLSNGGTLEAVFPVTPPTQVSGTSTSVYSRAQGARIDWGTEVIAGGRRLRGRTYLVPIVGTAFATDGLLTPANVTLITNAANAFIASLAPGSELAVWSRRNATTAQVTDVSVPPAGAILRGRRD